MGKGINHLVAFAAMILVIVSGPNIGKAATCTDIADFNCYMLASVKIVEAAHRNKTGKHFNENADIPSRSFKYGASAISRDPGNVHGAMTGLSCNGAIYEVVLTALELYQRDHPGVPLAVPPADWNTYSNTRLRAHIGMYDMAAGFKSNSVARAFERFGLGTRVKREDLKPGDIVTFDRELFLIKRDNAGKPTLTQTKSPGSTHSVVFMGWLDGSELKSDDWDEMARPTSVTFANAKGFKYFSSQSNWTPDQTLAVRRSGLSVRFAYFSGFCPQDAQNKVEGGDKRYCPDQRHQDKRAFTPAFPQLTLRMRTDCCVISRDAELTSTSNNEQGLRGGRVFAPSQWGDYSMRRSVVEREYAAIKKKP